MLNSQDDPVANGQITYAVTKIKCFCECAKGGDISINAFVLLDLKVYLSKVSFSSPMVNSSNFCIIFARSFLSSGMSNWKPLKIFNTSTPMQWRNKYAGGFVELSNDHVAAPHVSILSSCPPRSES